MKNYNNPRKYIYSHINSACTLKMRVEMHTMLNFIYSKSVYAVFVLKRKTQNEF